MMVMSILSFLLCPVLTQYVKSQHTNCMSKNTHKRERGMLIMVISNEEKKRGGQRRKQRIHLVT